jgi:hypothetical protein
VKKLGLVAVFALGAIMVVSELNPVPGVGSLTATPSITEPSAGEVVGPAVTVEGSAVAGSEVKVYNSSDVLLGTTTASGNGSWEMTLAFANGEHTIYATARFEGASVSGASGNVTFTVDAVAPDTSITGGPSGTVSALTASLTFSSDDNLATFECLLDADPADAANWAACESPKNYTDLERGEHVFMVRAVDAVGNTDGTPAERSWKIGRPVVEVAVPADGTYYAGTELIIEVDWDATVWVSCTRTNQEALPCALSPKIPLTIGDATRYAVADATGGSGADTVTFRYFIQRNDVDTDGIVVGPAILFDENDCPADPNGPCVPRIMDEYFGCCDVAPSLPSVVTTGVRVNGSVFPSVTTTSDSGPGSLRAAIAAANNVAGQDTIVFADPLTCETAPCNTITLASRLPGITGDLIIIGPGAANLTISGSGTARIMQIETGSVNLSGITFANGGGGGSSGGAISNGGTLTVTDSVFLANTGRDGGAILNGGTLTVRNSTFDANTARFGGAIYNAGELEVTNSTFYANTALLASLEGGGGGIYNAFAVVNPPTARVTNSTFSENQARVACCGQGGGGIYNGGTLHLTNTILFNNTASTLNATFGDCRNDGTIGTNVSNLFVTGNCGAAAVTTDPLLVALADNGGPTRTMAIPDTSPAWNAGTNAGCPTTDQRGGIRAKTDLNRCDIGAFEFGAGFLNLASLSLSEGTLTPGFAAGTTTYTASVDHATTSIGVTATLADPTNSATLTWRLRDQQGTNAYTAFSSPQTVNLAVGDNVIDLEVTMESCCTRVYTVTVTRAEGSGGGDTTKPEVDTFALQTASDTGVADDDGVTNAAVLVYDLVFTEPVTGLSFEDFTVTGTSTRCRVSTNGSEDTYTVTLSKCTGGTVTLTLNADSVSDGTNDGPTTAAAVGGVTIDRTAPAVSAFAGNGTAGYTLTFQEPVTGLDANDFTLSGRSLGSCAVSTVTGTDGSPLAINGIEFHRSWTVAVTSCPTRLTLTLNKGAVDDVPGNVGPPKAVRARTTTT